MTIAICTSWDENYKELAAVTSLNHEKYCVKHGYQYYGVCETSPRKSPHWLKLPAIQRGLEAGHDFVVWMDADVYITNDSISLDKWLVADFVCSYDFQGLNAGVLFIRNSKWSRDFVERWWR